MVGFRESCQFLRIKNGISSNLVYSDLDNIKIFFQDFFDLGASQKKSDKSRFLLKIIRFKIRKKYSAILHCLAVIHHLGLSRQFPWPRRDKTRFSLDPRFSIFRSQIHDATANPRAFRRQLAAFSRPGREQFFREKKQFPAVGWRSTKSTRRHGFFEDFVVTDFSMIFQFSSTLKSIFGDSAPHEDFSDQPARKFIKFYEVHVVGLFEKNVP